MKDKIIMKPSYGASILTFTEGRGLVFTGSREFAKDFIEENSKFFPTETVMEMLSRKNSESFTGNIIEISLRETNFEFRLRSYGIEVSFDYYERENILRDCLSSMPLLEVWNCLPLKMVRNIHMVLNDAVLDICANYKVLKTDCGKVVYVPSNTTAEECLSIKGISNTRTNLDSVYMLPDDPTEEHLRECLKTYFSFNSSQELLSAPKPKNLKTSKYDPTN